ncbi:MAG TPA: hypothetical protein VMS77_06165 [Conexivisphaerales archaeon]|nr:hypothetical protein [Conexivisphaerales archaeon]
MDKAPWVVGENLWGKLDFDTPEGQKVAVWAILIFCRRPGTTRLSGARVKTILRENGISFVGNQPAIFLKKMARFYGWKRAAYRRHCTFEVPFSSMAGESRWYLLD